MRWLGFIDVFYLLLQYTCDLGGRQILLIYNLRLRIEGEFLVSNIGDSSVYDDSVTIDLVMHYE